MNETDQERLTTLIAIEFKNGYRLSSSIDFERLRNYYVNEFGGEFRYNSDCLSNFCASKTLIYDDRAYVFSNDAVNVVQSYLAQVGAPCIFIGYLYEKHINEFYTINIFSADMLRVFIERYYPYISVKSDYIMLKEDISPEDIVKDVYEERETWSFEELQERLPYLKSETIQQAKKSSEYIRVRKDVYTHIENMDLPDAEGINLIALIEKYLSKFEYVTVNELDLSKFEELNPECSSSTLSNAVFQKFLADEYVRIGQIITRKGTVLEYSADEVVDYSQTDYDSIFEEVLIISPGLGPLIEYIRDIAPPQWGEWRILLPEARSKNLDALKRLIDMNLRVVLKIALNTYKTRGYELEDLVQEGAMGLMRAIDRFEIDTQETSFVSYMPWWIRQYINRALDDKSRIIRLPVHMIDQVNKIKNASEKLSIVLGRDPTPAELSNELFIPEDKVRFLLNKPRAAISLDSTIEEVTMDVGLGTAMEIQKAFQIADSHGEPIRNYIHDDANVDPFESVSSKLLKEQLANILNTLTPHEEKILRLRFGIECDRERTLEEVGREFNVTRERIRQIEKKALRKLQHPSRSKKLKGYLFP